MLCTVNRLFDVKVVGMVHSAEVSLVCGVTFANTRALLLDFSALEIMVVRFVMAWAALWGTVSLWRRFGEVSRILGYNYK